jgi:hypothetical protein
VNPVSIGCQGTKSIGPVRIGSRGNSKSGGLCIDPDAFDWGTVKAAPYHPRNRPSRIHRDIDDDKGLKGGNVNYVTQFLIRGAVKPRQVIGIWNGDQELVFSAKELQVVLPIFPCFVPNCWLILLLRNRLYDGSSNTQLRITVNDAPHDFSAE